MRSLTPEEIETILHKESTCPNCGQPIQVCYYRNREDLFNAKGVCFTRAVCKPCDLDYMIVRSWPDFKLLSGFVIKRFAELFDKGV